jgi:hypothetical protein
MNNMTQPRFSSIRSIYNVPLLPGYDPSDLPPLKKRDMHKLLKVYQKVIYKIKKNPVEAGSKLRLYLWLPNDQIITMTRQGQRVGQPIEAREWETIFTTVFNMRKRRCRLRKHVAAMIFFGHSEPSYSADIVKAMQVVALEAHPALVALRIG